MGHHLVLSTVNRLLLVVVGRGRKLLRASIGLATADSEKMLHEKRAQASTELWRLVLKAWHVFGKLNLREN